MAAATSSGRQADADNACGRGPTHLTMCSRTIGAPMGSATLPLKMTSPPSSVASFRLQNDANASSDHRRSVPERRARPSRAAARVASEERVVQRNGYRHHDFDTRAGTLDVAVPKLRQGTYFPEWLLERRTRAERVLTSVVATCYLLGVSTWRMNKLVQSLGITGRATRSSTPPAVRSCR